MDITGKTQLICLLGSPVSHSISPQMHNEAFRQLDLDYVYLAFDVKPAELIEAVAGLKAIGVRGFNLTMPLKQAILPLLDKVSPAASLAEAVNTVVCEDGRLLGDSTDGLGYMCALKEAGIDAFGKKLTILGAGGAGTAICVQAALDGVAAIDLFDLETSPVWKSASVFCQKLSAQSNCTVNLYDSRDFVQLKNSILGSTVLTNATGLGMGVNLDKSPLSDISVLFPELLVSDLAYHPRETLFLRQGREIGCRTLNGLDMLLYQGAAAFTAWTGMEMPVELIREKYFSAKSD